MTALSDDLLKRIATGSGRVYPHEGKAMARELIERRSQERLEKTQPIPNIPWGVLP
jgi:hypothetical protein